MVLNFLYSKTIKLIGVLALSMALAVVIDIATKTSVMAQQLSPTADPLISRYIQLSQRLRQLMHPTPSAAQIQQLTTDRQQVRSNMAQIEATTKQLHTLVDSGAPIPSEVYQQLMDTVYYGLQQNIAKGQTSAAENVPDAKASQEQNAAEIASLQNQIADVKAQMAAKGLLGPNAH